MNLLLVLRAVAAAFQSGDLAAIWAAIKQLGDLFLGNNVAVMGAVSPANKKECEELCKSIATQAALCHFEPNNVAGGPLDNRPFLKALADLFLKLAPLILPLILTPKPEETAAG